MQFYTSAFLARNKIFVRAIDETGKSVRRAYEYSPYLFLPSKRKNAEYRSIRDEPLDKIEFGSINEAKDFIKQYEDVQGFKIYGMTNFVYPFLNDYFPGEINYDLDKVSIVNIDIENIMGRESISTSISEAPNEITSITMGHRGKYYVFTCTDYKIKDDSEVHFRCKDEKELLIKFIDMWNHCNPDIVTGWNIEFYDIPYLVNRIRRLLGEDYVKKLSPWGMIRSYQVEVKGDTINTYEFRGVATLDYMQIYKKFTFKNQESFKLDHIAHIELEESKVDYSEYDNLNDLYYRNPQLYVEYNIKDVRIVDRLEEKMKLLELVMAMAYDAKINFNDTLTTVRQWDVITHNYLLKSNIAVDPQVISDYEDVLVGGYVKDPVPGLYDWVVSFDLNSLYPHLIMQYNISPDTYVGQYEGIVSVDTILEGNYPVSDYIIAANGSMYRRDKRGFLAELMESFYQDRSKFKKLMLENEKLYETTKDEKYKLLAGKYHNIQLSKKIQLNSAYGALANKYFRWMSFHNAEAITTSGQLSIKFISKKINEYLNKLCKTEGVDRVIGIDTDSCYILFEDVVKLMPRTFTVEIGRYIDKFCNEVLEPKIDSWYNELALGMNAYSQKMKMKRESIADRAIWTGKKRYMMHVLNSEGVEYEIPKIKMVGVEAVKSSTPMICRKKLKDAIKLILTYEEEDVQRFIAKFREEFSQLPFEEVASPRGISELNKYSRYFAKFKELPKGTPIHVKAALAYNNLVASKKLAVETIGDGDKIKFVYMKMPNPYGEKVMGAPGDLHRSIREEITSYIDYNTQFEKNFLKPILIILDAIGWKHERKADLNDLFA